MESRYRHRRAEALQTKKQEGRINGAEYSASVEVEQHGESSRMAESRGSVGGGFFFDNPVFTFGETNGEWQDEPRTELVSDSDETIDDAPANEDRATNSFPVVTYGPHVPSIPLREHQRPTTPTPAPTETTNSFSDESDTPQTFEYPTPTRDFSIGPYPIVLRGLPTAARRSPSPPNQTATNFHPLPRNPPSFQFRVNRPAPPEIPIDPVLLEIDAERIRRERGL
ncbi:hypothetical protein MMC22_001691 [Lobaria immixta]|nr:hypothetical protein [Lobaria immixta]